MSRPHKMTADRGLQPDTAAILHVKRDTMTGAWRLAWLVPGDTCFCYAEGECSAVYYRTRRAAVQSGAYRFGEIARNWPRV